MSKDSHHSCRLCAAAGKLFEEHSKLAFEAEAIANTAIEVSGGDALRAEALLCSLEEFIVAALLELRTRRLSEPNGVH